MLEVIIGMIFTFMLLGLLGTTVNELVSAWRGWRGFFLEEGLRRLLEFKDNPAVFEKFRNNPLFRQMMQNAAPLRVSQAPAYLSSANFANMLTNVLKKKNEAVQTVDDLLAGLPEDGQLRQVLQQLKDEGHETVDDFKKRLQLWFDDVMAQASSWYKRHLQFVTLLVGLSIAAVLNADSFQIYRHLTTNTAARQKLAQLAKAYASENETLPTATVPGDSLTAGQIKNEVKNFVNSKEFKESSNILGLGWAKNDVRVSFKDWLLRLLGWFVTALAISLGAPFWFDALKKIITIQSSGPTTTQSGTGGAQVVINTGEAKKN